jgi:hypothetical protein
VVSMERKIDQTKLGLSLLLEKRETKTNTCFNQREDRIATEHQRRIDIYIL